MAELEQVRGKATGNAYNGQGQFGTPSRGFRENGAARRVGSALAFEKPPSSHGYKHTIEPSLKDKLVQDQVRINNLKAD